MGNPKLLILDASFPKGTQILEVDQRISRALSSVPSVVGGEEFHAGRGQRKVVTIASNPTISDAAKFKFSLTIPWHKGVVERITINHYPSATLNERVPLAHTIPN